VPAQGAFRAVKSVLFPHIAQTDRNNHSIVVQYRKSRCHSIAKAAIPGQMLA
jgi:hypothetical protein